MSRKVLRVPKNYVSPDGYALEKKLRQLKDNKKLIATLPAEHREWLERFGVHLDYPTHTVTTWFEVYWARLVEYVTASVGYKLVDPVLEHCHTSPTTPIRTVDVKTKKIKANLSLLNMIKNFHAYGVLYGDAPLTYCSPDGYDFGYWTKQLADGKIELTPQQWEWFDLVNFRPGIYGGLKRHILQQITEVGYDSYVREPYFGSPKSVRKICHYVEYNYVAKDGYDFHGHYNKHMRRYDGPDWYFDCLHGDLAFLGPEIAKIVWTDNPEPWISYEGSKPLRRTDDQCVVALQAWPDFEYYLDNYILCDDYHSVAFEEANNRLHTGLATCKYILDHHLHAPYK